MLLRATSVRSGGGGPSGAAGRSVFQSVTALLCCACLLGSMPGCVARTWQAVPLGTPGDAHALEERDDGSQLRVELTTTDGTRHAGYVTQLAFPWIELDAEHLVDLREVVEAQALLPNDEEEHRRRVAWVIAGIVTTAAAIPLLIALIVALTKTSCPFVYIERDGQWELVGEAYSGAAVRAAQRDDLMPLPTPDGTGRLRLQMVNEAHESHYTDRVDLVVADHPATVRALATLGAEVVTVGPAVTPASVVDLTGVDHTASLGSHDDRLWQTDLDAVSFETEPPSDEGLVARFEAPAGPGELVLELRAGNTAWADLVMGRMWAAFGRHLRQHQRIGARPEAGETVARWRAEAGVDLTVERRDGGEWHEVGIVHVIGPGALRTMAVPLGIAAGDGDSIELRVSGAMGFWRLDHLALSRVADVEADIQLVDPALAQRPGGTDERPLLARTDGAYSELPDLGDSMLLEFELPAGPAGPGAGDESRTRSLFLFSNGYYTVHRPPQSKYRPGLLVDLRDDDTALGRFSVALYREYRAQVLAVAEPPRGNR